MTIAGIVLSSQLLCLTQIIYETDLSMPNKEAREKAFKAAYAVYTYNVDGQPATLFDNNHADYAEPVWSRDGRVELKYYDGYHYFYTNERVVF